MRAVVVSEPGGSLALSRSPAPEPGSGELLVSVQCTSVNPVDVYVATGQYKMGEIRYPLIPGHDFAGVVERIGDGVRGFAAGDRVLGMRSTDFYGDGSWAELVTVPADGLVAHWPDGLEPARAAALPLAALTAALALEFVAPAPGEALVVIGAAGAVGRYAVQLAARSGVEVTATARPGSEEAALALGASSTVDPGADDLTGELRSRFPTGVPALIDLASGRRALARLAELVSDGGRVVSALFSADADALATRRIRALNVRTYDADPAMLAELAGLAAIGELSVAVDDVTQLDRLPCVVGELAAGDRRGKVVATLS